jgi:folate-binding protein YgfZ
MSVPLDAVQVRAYHAIASHAGMVDRTSRMRMTFTGDKAKETLGGLLTNDITALTKGAGLRAAALTPKGRVIALLRVFDRGDDLLVDADAAAGAGFVAMIRKYVNPRLARHAELTAATACLGVYGPKAAETVARALAVTAESLEALPLHAHLREGAGDEAVTIVRSADLGVMGLDLVAGVRRIAVIADALDALGIARVDDAVADILAVESGIPRWGIEMDAETLPQEANLDALGAISFDKGCYTGQEVVARIHFRGHVNRHLRRLSAEAPLVAGATLTDMEGKEVGQIRTAVVSPAHGPLALAMVRREVAPGGEVLTSGADGRAIRARVEAVPTT